MQPRSAQIDFNNGNKSVENCDVLRQNFISSKMNSQNDPSHIPPESIADNANMVSSPDKSVEKTSTAVAKVVSFL